MNRRLALVLLAAACLLAACGSPLAAPAAPASAPSTVGASPAVIVTRSAPPSIAGATPGSSEPASSATTDASPTVAPDSPAPTASPAAPFALTTPSFHAGGMIPAAFTCDGRDVSPALTWAGTPVGTARLVLTVTDPDAHGFTHWIAFAIAAGTTRLEEGAGVASSQLAQGTNDFGRVGYGGPCPPSGTHRYVFTLYALAAPLGLDGIPTAATVRAALARADILGKTSITALYTRGG